MPCDRVVDGIAPGARDESEHRSQPPRHPAASEQGEHRVGTDMRDGAIQEYDGIRSPHGNERLRQFLTCRGFARNERDRRPGDMPGDPTDAGPAQAAFPVEKDDVHTGSKLRGAEDRGEPTAQCE